MVLQILVQGIHVLRLLYRFALNQMNFKTGTTSAIVNYVRPLIPRFSMFHLLVVLLFTTLNTLRLKPHSKCSLEGTRSFSYMALSFIMLSCLHAISLGSPCNTLTYIYPCSKIHNHA